MVAFRPCLAAFSALLGTLALLACQAASGPGPDTVAMKVESVLYDARTSSPVLLLREQAGARRELPIWIGPHVAQSIAIEMEHVEVPRPNTHDLIENVLQGLGVEILRVVVTELRGSTYYAEIELDLRGHSVAIDSRPSDAIAIAVRTGTPVFATDRVLKQAGRLADDDEALDASFRSEPGRPSAPL